MLASPYSEKFFISVVPSGRINVTKCLYSPDDGISKVDFTVKMSLFTLKLIEASSNKDTNTF